MSFSLPTLFLTGVLTFLSPCVLPLVPVYLAMLGGASVAAVRDGSARRPVGAAAAFSLGLALVFVTLGLAASAVGHVLSSQRTLIMQLAGLAIFLAGLKLMGFVHAPWLDREARPWLTRLRRSGGLAWPFLFGAAFALGWSPCVGPILGSVLAFAANAGHAGRAATYLGVYALGLTLPLMVVALLAPLALRTLDRIKRYLRTFEVTTGALLAVMGLLLITGHASWMGTPSPSASPTAAVPSEPAPVTCSAGPLPSPSVKPDENTSAHEQIPTMLEFVSAHCPICQRMHPVVAAAERDCARHGVQVQQVDVSTDAGRALAARHGVLGVPTFIFLDSMGKEVARLVGEQPAQTLIQALEVLAGEKCDGFRPLSPTAGS
jgi:cytochrome c-type biogenesis protein